MLLVYRNQNISEAIHGSQVAADEGGKNLVSGNASEASTFFVVHIIRQFAYFLFLFFNLDRVVNKCVSGDLIVREGRQASSHHFFNHDQGRSSGKSASNKNFACVQYFNTTEVVVRT